MLLNTCRFSAEREVGFPDLSHDIGERDSPGGGELRQRGTFDGLNERIIGVPYVCEMPS